MRIVGSTVAAVVGIAVVVAVVGAAAVAAVVAVAEGSAASAAPSPVAAANAPASAFAVGSAAANPHLPSGRRYPHLQGRSYRLAMPRVEAAHATGCLGAVTAVGCHCCSAGQSQGLPKAASRHTGPGLVPVLVPGLVPGLVLVLVPGLVPVPGHGRVQPQDGGPAGGSTKHNTARNVTGHAVADERREQNPV